MYFLAPIHDHRWPNMYRKFRDGQMRVFLRCASRQTDIQQPYIYKQTYMLITILRTLIGEEVK